MLNHYQDRAGNPCGPRGYEQMDSHADRSRHEPMLADAELQEIADRRLAGLDSLAKGDTVLITAGREHFQDREIG